MFYKMIIQNVQMILQCLQMIYQFSKTICISGKILTVNCDLLRDYVTGAIGF